MCFPQSVVRRRVIAAHRRATLGNVGACTRHHGRRPLTTSAKTPGRGATAGKELTSTRERRRHRGKATVEDGALTQIAGSGGVWCFRTVAVAPNIHDKDAASDRSPWARGPRAKRLHHKSSKKRGTTATGKDDGHRRRPADLVNTTKQSCPPTCGQQLPHTWGRARCLDCHSGPSVPCWTWPNL